MHRLYFLTVAAICALNACGSNSEQSTTTTGQANKPTYEAVAAAKWLCGAWTCPAGDAMVIESWAAENDSTLAGKSYIVKGKDTMPDETIILQQRGAEVAYIPTVTNQNAGQPVKFVQTSANGKEWVFENPTHDFPQKIKYTKVTNDSLVATISGREDGIVRDKDYPMRRIK